MALEAVRYVITVTIFKEEGNCIVCLEMRADELMRRLISGELTNYSVVRTSLEPLQKTTWKLHMERCVLSPTLILKRIEGLDVSALPSYSYASCLTVQPSRIDTKCKQSVVMIE